MMASRNDIVMDLRAGFGPEEIAVRRQANLIWIEIIAGKRIPDCAMRRQEARLQRLAREGARLPRAYERERLAA